MREECPRTVELEPDGDMVRCSGCAERHYPEEDLPASSVSDGGVPDVARVIEQLDIEGKDVHLHVHYHDD